MLHRHLCLAELGRIGLPIPGLCYPTNNNLSEAIAGNVVETRD